MTRWTLLSQQSADDGKTMRDDETVGVGRETVRGGREAERLVEERRSPPYPTRRRLVRTQSNRSLARSHLVDCSKRSR